MKKKNQLLQAKSSKLLETIRFLELHPSNDDIYLLLPTETWTNIFEYLSVQDIHRLEQVCHWFGALLADSKLHHSFTFKQGHPLPKFNEDGNQILQGIYAGYWIDGMTPRVGHPHSICLFWLIDTNAELFEGNRHFI
jgi:hypothetical protein